MDLLKPTIKPGTNLKPKERYFGLKKKLTKCKDCGLFFTKNDKYNYIFKVCPQCNFIHITKILFSIFLVN